MNCFRPKAITSLTLLLILVLSSLGEAATNEIMVFPTRLVLDARSRAGQLDIVNSGQETITVRIGLERKRMDEFGQMKLIGPGEELLAGEQTAEEIIRFSPRRCTLAPGAGQTIRVLARRMAAISDGEYRSHLFMIKEMAAANVEQDSEKTGQKVMDIRLTANIGLSVPIIYRHGNLSVAAEITDVGFRAAGANGGVVEFVINRSGKRSVYGDLKLSLQRPGQPDEDISSISGVAVYVPNERRLVRVETKLKSIPAGSRLVIAYQERNSDAPIATYSGTPANLDLRSAGKPQYYNDAGVKSSERR